MKKLLNNITFFALVFGMICSIGAQNNNQLIIFHAGSLTVPFQKIIDGFKKDNPGVEVLKEIAGSRECARKISELKKPCDVFASADYVVIDQLLIPEFASWNLRFASNEMAIVYTAKSRRAKEISQNNWHKILLDDKINFGRSDPNSDPCGYRTVLTMKLAESFYKQKGLSDKVLSKDNEYIRPKEVDLLALLEAGEVDYIFLYRSVAEQHGLKYLILPDEINLKKAELEDHYKQVSVELSGKKPGEQITQAGGSMVYGVTIPKNSPNHKLAIKFVLYLMDNEKGLKVMREMGQPTVVPSLCEHYDKLPKELKKFAKKK
ncbi:MAG: molybdate/tungstate transport system substrate-binding protein [Ignavibacteria bacterium]|nr:MAG: molybdate/tungstate transport system substrate-binding protein [Ignavibacteria bacterium]KAF0160675.1 MAG: molybdate/tungstate transport system substrate-binding protein [Ignavibacteria bacterium]